MPEQRSSTASDLRPAPDVDATAVSAGRAAAVPSGVTGETRRLDLDALADLVGTELRRWQVPGVELAAVRDGKVVVAEGYGLRDHARGLPATAATLFHHGSITKAFTATLAGTLVDEGLLEWDRPVRDLWPPFRLHDPVATERVSVADLLSHRSGLAAHEWAWLAHPSSSSAELAGRLRHLPMGHDLRVEFEYCNLGYVLAGQVIEAVTGTDWHAALRERVLDPLGMHATLTSLEQAESRADHAQPHDVRAGEIVPVPFRLMGGLAPAGLLFSCASDIARWLLFHLGDGGLDGCRVLSAQTLAELHRIRVPLDGATPDPEIHHLGYALGWGVGSWSGRRILWHRGGIDGFATELLLLPDEGVGVALSANCTHTSDLPAVLTRHVAQQLLGEQPQPWAARLHERWQRERNEATPTPDPVPGTTPSRPIADFAGGYHHPGYGMLTVEVEGGELHLRLGELALATRHRHFDTWTLDYPPLSESTSVTFHTDADGVVRDAVLPLDDSTGEVTFRRRPDHDDKNERENDAAAGDRVGSEPVEDGLQERLEALLAEVTAPGAVLAVLRGGEVVDYAAGTANLDTGAAMTTDTLFPIASVTKLYTATLVMQLVDDGLLDLDEPLRTYLPGFRVADPHATETLTARHLLTHTGGIDGDKFDRFGRGDDALGRYVDDCASLGQVHDVGATYSYCNSGFIILGHLVSVLRSASWDDVLRERLLRPVGATHSGTLPEDLVWFRLAAGHQTGDDGHPAPLRTWEMERAHGPAGGVLASARDVLRFVRMHLAGGTAADGGRVLSGRAAAAMVTPQVAVPNPHGSASHCGLGWDLYRPGEPLSLIGHDGDLLGHHAQMLACPEAGLTVVLLVNGDGAHRIARTLFPRILAEVGAAPPQPVGPPPATPPALDLAAVEGSYQTLAVRATVTAAGDQLDMTLRVIAPEIAAMMPESRREQHATFVPVSQSLFLRRDDEEDLWEAAVFTEAGGQRYLYIGGRAMRATAGG